MRSTPIAVADRSEPTGERAQRCLGRRRVVDPAGRAVMAWGSAAASVGA